MSSMVKQQLWAMLRLTNQVFLLLAIVKVLFLSLVQGSVSLGDIHSRVLLQLEHPQDLDTAQGDSPLSDIQSDLTCDVSEETATPRLPSATRALCRTIVRCDLKAVTRYEAKISSSPTGAYFFIALINATARWKLHPTSWTRAHEGGWYPLHAAVLSGDIELVKLVLSYPTADVNVVYKPTDDVWVMPTDREYELGTLMSDISGATPLHLASMVGSVEIIRLLLDHGALFKAMDDKKREPIDYCDIQNSVETVTVLQELYNKWKDRDKFFKGHVITVNDLAQMIRDDMYELFESSVEKNPGIVSDMAHYGLTLLHLAVIRRRRRSVELLVASDQSLVNMFDERSYYDYTTSHDSFASRAVPHEHVKDATPLHYACLVQDMEIAKILLEAGADWTLTDWKGRIPEDLIYATEDKAEALKSTSAQLCDMEDEKRKKAEEEEGEVEGEDQEEDQGEDQEMEDQGQDKDGDEEIGEEKEPDNDNTVKSDTGDERLSDNDDATPSRVSIESLLALESAIGEKLVGQRGPIRAVANAIRLRESHWIDPDRPLTMLFLGSSGVGKTELAKQLALLIHGKDGSSSNEGQNISKLEENFAFVRLDMSEYQERHTVFNLIGSPKSYAGYGDGSTLTRPLRKNPKAVVLLDEIEKAHPDVLTTFLQVFDDGRITDSQHGVISCKDAIFIMTSNIAADEIKCAAPRLRQAISQSGGGGRADSYFSAIQEFIRSIRPQLKKHLRRDEFVGRINEIAVFLPLDEEEIQQVVQHELESWRKRAEEKHNITLAWADGVVHRLAKAYDVNYGVRSVANEVQRIAVQLVADAYIRGQIADNWQFTLTMNENGDITLIANSPPQEKSNVDIDTYLNGFRTERCICGLR